MSAPTVFSIRPEYTRLILAGSKLWEIRRSPCRQVKRGDLALIYESLDGGRGRGRIVAAFTVGRMITSSTASALHAVVLWCGGGIGISKRKLAEYLEGAREPTAIELLDVQPRDLPLPEGMRAPQSWARYDGPWPS